ncbi:5'-nucleotidase C-terminal domain-containing protein [Alphaproteobacteria bacterium KMM 3653]|uniref:5'-nucleotidase C-terminal domain-containing protein n=1 Tax=Harenicola maris TaxID=2841044 RepID=A0AAP2CRP8_9RHOB|nr:5'-nucleotidase C-terminal domain-containing protein [Harenicola maris]
MKPLHKTGPEEVILRILATSDIHGALLTEEDPPAQRMCGMGLAQAAVLVGKAREDMPGSILLDCGDFIQGTPCADRAITHDEGEDNPTISAMNVMGYDAVTLGNHEFNYGPHVLARLLKQAKFTAISSNLVALDDAPSFAPYAMIERQLEDGRGTQHTIRIGVIGLLPPQTLVWDRDHLAGHYQIMDIPTLARLLAAQLRADGAHVVVALCHSGISDSGTLHPSEHAATDVAQLRDIDAVICGHTHRVFPGEGHAPTPLVDPDRGLLAGTPAVMPGVMASHVGQIDLRLARRAGTWRVDDGEASLLKVADRPEGSIDPAVQRVAAPAIARLRDALAQSLGHSDLPLHTFFSLAAPSPALALIAAAQAQYTRTALAGSKWENLPLVSVTAPFRSGGWNGTEEAKFTHIPKGPVTGRGLFNLYEFPNTAKTLLMTGAQLRQMILNATDIYAQVTPGRSKQALIRSDVPAYMADSFYGLSYEIDLSKPQGDPGRLRSVNLNGKPLQARTRVAVAANNHRANLLQDQNACREELLSEGVLVRDIIAGFIKDRPVTEAMLPPCPWRFAPLQGTSALFLTGPSAHSYEAEAKAAGIQLRTPTDCGRLEARIKLGNRPGPG